MQKWFRQNLTAALVVTLLAGYGAGAAIAAVLKSDVERLKRQVDGMPEQLVRVEQKVDDTREAVKWIRDNMVQRQ